MIENPLNLNDMNEWVDFDVALFLIGRALGVFANEYHEIPNIKPLLWSQNPVNNCLYNIANELVRIGYLEYDEDASKYRRNRNFQLQGP